MRERIFFVRAILAALAILIAAALGACAGYDQSPENNRWRVYRLERAR